MKARYYIGDSKIPWWVKRLAHKGLIKKIRENSPTTYILTYKTSYFDTSKNYLYEGDFLELDSETGAVTIGHEDWDSALAEEFKKINRNKFIKTLENYL